MPEEEMLKEFLEILGLTDELDGVPESLETANTRTVPFYVFQTKPVPQDCDYHGNVKPKISLKVIRNENPSVGIYAECSECRNCRNIKDGKINEKISHVLDRYGLAPVGIFNIDCGTTHTYKISFSDKPLK